MATAHVPQTPRRDPARPSREETRGRHLRVVRPDEGRWLRLRLTPVTGLGLIVVLFAALFAVAVSHALLIEGQAQLDRLDAEVAEQQAHYERLRVDVAELESPERILDDARALGMVPADDVQWLTPERPVDGDGRGSDVETSGTSWDDVKPYVGSTP